MQTINYDISQVLQKVNAGHFVLPQFQRDFTWRDGQSKLLIDSIARGYPVGALLLFGKKGEGQFKYRPLDVQEFAQSVGIIAETLDTESQADIYYVLDGQQRLTSIARIFLDTHPQKNYYFDLHKMHYFFDAEDVNWIISRARGKKNPERKGNNRYLRSDVAFDQKKCDVFISEYFEDSDDFPEFQGSRTEAREAAARIKGVFENIRKYLTTFMVVDGDASIESICRIFETINSTGTRLTTFDLAVARYYPDPDLKQLHESGQEDYAVLRDFEVEGERILEILAMYYLSQQGKNTEPTRKEKLSLPKPFVSDNWFLATESLAKVYSWAQHQGATPNTKPPHGLIVSIATLVLLHPHVLEKEGFPHILKKWYFSSILAKVPSAQTNNKICSDFRCLRAHIEDGVELLCPAVFFTPEELITIKRKTDWRYGAIQSLMRITARDDLLTGLPLDDDTENHHIYPYSLSKLSGFDSGKINSVVNQIVVSRQTNRSIGNTNPSKYLGDLIAKHSKAGSIGDLNRRFTNLFIPYNADDPDFARLVSNDNFDGFLLDRASMIISRIKEVVGDSWQQTILSISEDQDLDE